MTDVSMTIVPENGRYLEKNGVKHHVVPYNDCLGRSTAVAEV